MKEKSGQWLLYMKNVKQLKNQEKLFDLSLLISSMKEKTGWRLLCMKNEKQLEKNLIF